MILETWSHGLPLISTASLGATELVEQEVTGLLCPCSDPEALAGQISALLLATDTRRRELGEAGRMFLRSQFSASSTRDST